VYSSKPNYFERFKGVLALNKSVLNPLKSLFVHVFCFYLYTLASRDLGVGCPNSKTLALEFWASFLSCTTWLRQSIWSCLLKSSSSRTSGLVVALPVCKPPIVFLELFTGLEVSMRKKLWPAPESARIEISGAAPTAAAVFFLICFLISAYIPTDLVFLLFIYLNSVFKSYIYLNKSILCLISIFNLVYNYFIWT